MKKVYFLIMLLPAFCFSQTAEERRKIAEQSDKYGNAVLLAELEKDENARLLRVENYLKQHPETNKITKFGVSGIKELKDVSANGDLLYVKTYNQGAAITARASSLYSGGSLGLNIQGQNMIAGIWDGGSVRTTHQEFLQGMFSKVNAIDGAAVADHATHVGGTIVASGVVPQVRGLAFNAGLSSYNWTNDISEMTTEASGGMVVSNHSYGPALSNDNQIWFLGAYASDARQVDALCFNNPFYLPVFAAGNNRNDVDPPYSTQQMTKLGYDMIAGDAIAKNVMTVAAVQNVANYTGPSSVIMSSFSSYGPTDDGRIKPDISMKGVNVVSTRSSSDTAIGSDSGTSMAAPGVTGVVLLLQQYYNQLYSNYMRAATVKGLILHTADEAGINDGPDYAYGWGLINAENAAKIIRDKNLSSNRTIIEENTLLNNATYTKSISASGSQSLKVSISWTDPQYQNVNVSEIDPTTKYLVNDLDLKITAANGTVYYPWKLQGMSSPSSAATRNSTNDVDNFERVDISLPAGNYTISVTHKGSLSGGSQKFSLIASGSNISNLSTNENSLKSDKIEMFPNPASDWINLSNTKGVDATVIILDASGKLVKKEILQNSRVSVRELVKGNYILLYSDNKNIEKSFKFIKL
ncbi:S8 family serine peptidase [Chryseobacterium luquanense]|uniref:S8 family serine peptidase n=1 Tax=Chryseobacterium luquanense TaxID=2983766 RepID=A0ABT3Y212_9FLAO|nr:S8 family serine peptidase [Chryseobacterium luquanense]MCX8532192.1 S8 family serine peptidase [Chryseobacterium luquanense]